MTMVATRLEEARQYGARLPEIEERLALLAEASRVLADASLEPPAVMERLCGLVVPLLGSACALRLLSEDGLWLRTVASAAAVPEARVRLQALFCQRVRADEGVAAEVLDSGEAQGVEAVLVLPLRARGRALGTLTVWREAPEPASFESGEQLLLQELADRAALALDVARAYASERQARQAAEVAAGRLARLQHVTAELSEALTAARVAEVVLEQGLAVADARAGALWAVEPDATSATLLRCAGCTPDAAERLKRMSLEGDSPVARVLRESRPVWLMAEDALAGTERPAPSSACLPLVADGRALGALVFTFGLPHGFDDDERAFLQLVAHHAAQALARARLLEREQRARAALREAHGTLEAIIQASPTAIMLLDPDGTVRLWNPAAERMLGWTAEEVLGKVLPAVPPEHWEAFRHGLERATRGTVLDGAPLAARRRDGGAVQVAMWTGRVHPASGPPQCLIVMVDITERQRGEAAQRFLAEAGGVLAGSLEEEETLERVAHLAVPQYAEACGVFLEDESGGVRCVATAGGSENGEVPPPGLAVVARVIQSGRPETRSGLSEGDPTCARAGGTCAYLCVPLRVRGHTLGALTFVTSKRAYDAQDLALAQELARRAALALDNASLYRDARQAIRLREEFLSIASHELKTPISALQLQVQSLLAGLNRSGAGFDLERLKRGLERVDRQVKRQTLLVNDLLDVSRLSAGKLELVLQSVELGSLVREVAERFEPEYARSGTPLELSLAPEVRGQWDRLRLDQVFTNLFSNALKYGRGNPVHVSLEMEGDRARLRVRDGGIGIAKEHLPRLFHRFERAVSERNYGGFGLGLWIARQIVEAMGGHIEVESVLGEGSTFIVELPRG
ncbi:GAF domain-containing protein [Corallococcus aberystwythensis]|uniref:histidine kinase n=1 Tax=Corallococcus aberystwythensis TaxID=2316722 RepID=A0A3A8QUC5_9BACT|nr:GAF domain-containing protein [Corallococcus aberystwythensis]RKH70510.1 GAF domain-containing protein [Corallococcus aberystwythensis]